MTHLTKAICRRAGWDYAQVVVEQSLSQSQNFWHRPRSLIGYGAYFSGSSAELGELTDLLSEQVEVWNAGKAPSIQLSRSSFEGWTLGGGLGEFVYLTQSSASLSSLATDEPTERLLVIADYQELPEQVNALSQFLSTVAIKAVCPTVSIHRGALQITYFGA